MRTRIAAAALAAAAALSLTACSSDSRPVKTTPDGAPTTSTGAAAPAKSSAKPAASAVAGVGDTVTIAGSTDVELAITLKKWLPSAKSGDEFFTPDKGKMWVAGQFQIKNVGTTAYSDSPGNCVQAADAKGQRFDYFYVDSITAGPQLPSTVDLTPGDTVLGWMVFEVPKGTTVTRVQYTPDSGFGEQTGQWSTT
ncbi:MAG: DUF4352 domain-containing protein [Streptomyces sp.]|nr:DUF4352 domain-containing protein [Streptomyces sp.]